MSPRAKSVLLTLLVAVVTHVAVVLALPRAIMGYVLSRLAAVTGTNRFYHAPLAVAEERHIVRPSPDLAYSVCVFDLRRGPVRITPPDSTAYMSVSGFAAQTDSFFAFNDQEISDEGLEVLLVGRQPSEPVPAHVKVVRSPTLRGVVLMRWVVRSPEHFAVVDEARKQARCEPVRWPMR